MEDIGNAPRTFRTDQQNWLNKLAALFSDVRATAAAAASTEPVAVPGPVGPVGPPGPPGVPEPYVPDLTPPPTPSGVVVVAGIDFIGIQTDAPVFAAGHGYARTIVYGAKYSGTGPLPTFSSAVVVHEFVGAVGAFPTDPKTQWHIWLKWRSVDGVESSVPSGGTTGHQATTGNDVAKLLEALANKITRSQLFSDIGAPIDLILAPNTTVNSPAWRVEQERLRAVGQEGTLQTNINTVQANLTTAQGTLQAGIDSANLARASADTAFALRVDTVAASSSNTGALTADPYFRAFSEHWDLRAGAAPTIIPNGRRQGVNVARAAAVGSQFFSKLPIAVRQDRTYRVSVNARRSADAPTNGNPTRLYLVVDIRDASGTIIPRDGTFWYYPVSFVDPTTSWTTFTALFGAGQGGNALPANAATAYVGCLLNYGSADAPAWVECEDLRFEDAEAFVVRSDLTASVANEHAAWVAGDTANAASISTVTARLNTGGDIATSIATAQSTADAAASSSASNASQITTVNARMNVGGDTYSSIVAAQSTANAAASQGTTNAGQITTIQSRLNSGGDISNAIATAQTTANTAVSNSVANASQITTLQSRLDTAGGGPNRLQNPTFGTPGAGSTAGWTVYNNDGGAVPTTATVVAGPDGYNALQVSWTGTNASTKGAFQAAIQYPRKANVWYVFAVKVAAPAGSSMLGQKVTLAYTNFGFTDFEVLQDPSLTTAYQWYVARGRKAVDDAEFYVSCINGAALANGSYLISQPVCYEGREFSGFNEGPLSASLQIEATTRASTDGQLLGQYTVKVDLNNYVAGFGLASTPINGVPTSSFIVRADSFSVASPSGPGITPIVPFAVQTTAQVDPVTGENLPAGVYMSAAYIRDLEVALGRFQNAIITNAMVVSLAADKITAGSLAVGSHIQSTSYTPGSGVTPGTGWRIDGDGTLRASNGIFWGTVYASAGAIGGITVDSSGVQSTNYTPGSAGTGWRLDNNGGVVLPATAIRGKLVTEQIQVGAVSRGAQPVLNTNNSVVISGASGDFFTVFNQSFTTDGGRYSINGVVNLVITNCPLACKSISVSVGLYINDLPESLFNTFGGNAWALTRQNASQAAAKFSVPIMTMIESSNPSFGSAGLKTVKFRITIIGEDANGNTVNISGANCLYNTLSFWREDKV